MGGAGRAAESGHITIAIVVVVHILVQSRGLNVAVVVTVVTPYVHCVVLSVLW